MITDIIPLSDESGESEEGKDKNDDPVISTLIIGQCSRGRKYREI